MKALVPRIIAAWRGPSRGLPAAPPGFGLHAAPGVRSGSGLKRRYTRMAWAALPVLSAWCWNAGLQLQALAAATSRAPVSGWRAGLLFGLEPTLAPAWLLGLACFLPLWLSSLLAVAATETVFATWRGRRIEDGWHLPALLYALLLPAGSPLPQAVFALVLGLVAGRLVFGGAGKHLLSPVLLAGILLLTGHPEAFRWVPPGGGWPEAATTWAVWIESGSAGVLEAGWDAWGVFLGRELSSFGATSTLACAAAGAYLAATGTISWRTLAGGALGLVAASLLGVQASDEPLWAAWYWHASLGGFAFCLVFLLADPGCAALTPIGRWSLGLLAGGLTIGIRLADPSHPDGSLYAMLLAALFAPLVDALAVQGAVRSRRRAEEAWP